MIERLDRRIPGAFRYVDATTGLPVQVPLEVRSDGARLARSRSGAWIVLEAPGLEELVGRFDALPALPTVESLRIDVVARDPSGRYLPIRHALLLPRSADPEEPRLEASLFRANDILLFPSPTAPTARGWAVVRTRVTGTDGAPLGGTRVRVTLPPTEPLQQPSVHEGWTEWRPERRRVRGEALLAIPGIPVTTFSQDEVADPAIQEVVGSIQASVDPGFDPESDPAPEPERFATDDALVLSDAQPLVLASGRETRVGITVTLA